MGLILLVVLLILLVGTAPSWPYSRGWGYYPSGGLGLIVVIVITAWLLGFFR
ncbi:MAG: DUF3309 domain-containing protein [Bryobacteraceae bacterium]